MDKIKRWSELEDWVEFYSANDFSATGENTYQCLANFGGPGAAVTYHFYARIRKGYEAIIKNVLVENRDFDLDIKPIDVTGCPDGYSWLQLGSVKTRRDYQTLIIEAPDGLEGLDRICSLQIIERLESGEIERRIAYEEKYGVEPLSGVPLGGIGAGKIEFCPDGIFRNITINGNIDTPIWRSEASFFALQLSSGTGSQGRILTRENLFGLPAIKNLEYTGKYPHAVLTCSEDSFPVTVKIDAFGTIIPRNIDDSALPAALFEVTLTNTTDESIKTKIALCMENFLGRGGSVATVEQRKTFDEGYYYLWDERNGNFEDSVDNETTPGILFSTESKIEKRSEGEYFITSSESPSNRLLNWDFENSFENPWSTFFSEGIFPESKKSISKGERTASALAVECNLEARESRKVLFSFCWYTPHFWQAKEFDYSHYYCNRFDSANAVSKYVMTDFQRLKEDSEQIGLLLQKSSLPEWFVESLCNDAYVASTDSWLTKDGRFSINEGASHMFGCMGTIDQKLYANHFFSLFFPELDQRELTAFAKAQGENGGIQHDLGYGYIDQTGKPHHWPDLSSALTILSLKHYLLTGDKPFIDDVYPVLVRALLEYQLGLDTDGDSIPNISGVGNTFDSEEFEGTSSYIASLWLAALKALEYLARQRNDSETATKCNEVFEKAKANAINELWNGEFFVNYYDSVKQKQCQTSHFSQIAGEFFSEFLGLGPCYGHDYAISACKSTLKLNYPADFRAPTNEATPEGKMPCRKLWGWPFHSKIYLVALPMLYGLPEDGLKTLERLDSLISEFNHDNRWDQRLFYEPDTGKQHWGRFYMTSPVTWYVYQTMVGYFLNKPLGKLFITPRLPASMASFQGPIFLPDCWLWLEYEAENSVRIKLLKSFVAELKINELILPLCEGTPTVSVNDTEQETEWQNVEEKTLLKLSLDLADLKTLTVRWKK